MADLEQEVHDLRKDVIEIQKEMAGLQGQLSSDIGSIKEWMKKSEETSEKIYERINAIDRHVAAVNTTGQLAQQHSNGNEKMFYLFGAVILSIITFIAGNMM